MYLLVHSLSPVLVLVAVMKPKELKTKISHATPLTPSIGQSRREYRTKCSTWTTIEIILWTSNRCTSITNFSKTIEPSATTVLPALPAK